MWLACYVVHARRVSWQAGARWFLRHLVDGDPASNNLSWQWVASTFAAKPYFMNRANVVQFSGDRFPKHAKNDPLDAPYEVLAERLFPQGGDATADAGEGMEIDLRRVEAADLEPAVAPADAVCWVHGDMLNPAHPALAGDRPTVFVFDPAYWDGVGLKPLAFAYECLLELPNVTVLRGETAPAVLSFANGRPVVTGDSPSPHVREMTKSLDATVLRPDPFVRLSGRVDLKRFSRYWRSAQKALGARASG